MQKDDNGQPKLGRSKNKLGPTIDGPQPDVTFTESGDVTTGGGMSTNLDPRGMPDHRRPLEFGGRNDSLTMYGLNPCDIPEGLNPVRDRKSHVELRPAYEMPLEAYEELLHATRDFWFPVLP
jgi:hypothetical protein